MKRKGIQKFRSLRSELIREKELSNSLTILTDYKDLELQDFKINVGALREFIMKSYQESHEIDITHSKEFIAPLTQHFRDLDVKIPHNGPITIMSPAQYIFWQREKHEDAKRTMAQNFHASRYGCDFIPTNED